MDSWGSTGTRMVFMCRSPVLYATRPYDRTGIKNSSRASCVGVDKKGAFVFQVDDEHAKRVDVSLLGSDGDISVIAGDIDPQKKLVLSGNHQIADGDRVRTRQAPAEPTQPEQRGLT